MPTTIAPISMAALKKKADSMSERARVLAVDDHEDILELIHMTLEPHYDVGTLSNPVDLFEIMEIFEPDLLILDVMMPRVSGFQLTELLRKGNHRHIPIIILSAKTTAGEIKHGYKVGATLYLTKPFQPERLIKNVQTQFQITPPLTKKKLTAEEVAGQVENKNAFRKGLLKLSSAFQKKDPILDIRRKLAAKMAKEKEVVDENDTFKRRD
jgi:DNA-binding response OmpR family regulator